MLAGLRRMRQRLDTASGVAFMTLENKAGMVNVIPWRDLADRQRRVMVESQLKFIHGKVVCKAGGQHLVAQRLENWNALLEGMRRGGGISADCLHMCTVGQIGLEWTPQQQGGVMYVETSLAEPGNSLANQASLSANRS